MDLARSINPCHSEPKNLSAVWINEGDVILNPSDIRRNRVRIHLSQESLRRQRLPFEQETI